MIDKILNKYYSKQLITNIEHFTIPYFVDLKVIQDKDYLGMLVCIKKPKYKETEYITIKSIYSHQYIYWLANLDKLNNQIIKGVKEYYKNKINELEKGR